MGVAVLTIFCNESFRIPKWREYYDEYCDDASLHIIIDNHSREEELNQVKEAFPHSTIICLPENGGVTAAYNAGIRYVMDKEDIDAVAFIGNDIKIEKGGLKKLHEFLFSNEKLGEVAPVLLAKDSNKIEDNGDYFSSALVMMEYDVPAEWSAETQAHICDGLPGAMNVGKLSMYRKIGLMDETLFMYSDEVDMGIRAKKAGYLMSSYPTVRAWHQHENLNQKTYRPPFSDYLTIRNKVYLAKKHYGFWKMIYVFLFFVFAKGLAYLNALIKKDKVKMEKAKWSLRGAFKGLVGDMSKNQYSAPRG